MTSIAPALRRPPWWVGGIARRGALTLVLACVGLCALTLTALAQAPLTPPSERGGAPGGAPLVGGTVTSGFAAAHPPGTYCYTQGGWCQLPSAGRPGQKCVCRTSSGQETPAGQVN